MIFFKMLLYLACRKLQHISFFKDNLEKKLLIQLIYGKQGSETVYILTRLLDSSGFCPLCPKTFQICPDGQTDPHEAKNAYLCIACDKSVFYHCRRRGDSENYMIGYMWEDGSIQSVKER